MSIATLIMTPVLAILLLLVGLEFGRMFHGWYDRIDPKQPQRDPR